MVSYKHMQNEQTLIGLYRLYVNNNYRRRRRGHEFKRGGGESPKGVEGRNAANTVYSCSKYS